MLKEHDFDGPKLREAIPYITKFQGKKIVLKIGGSVLDDLSQIPALIDDVAFLKRLGIRVILVHGGAKQLSRRMEEVGLKPQSINGLRVTTAEVLELAAEVFTGISDLIGGELKKHGVRYHRFGREDVLVRSTRMDPALGLGFVGNPVAVDVTKLDDLDEELVPIVSAVTGSVDGDATCFNVNADDVAGAIAEAIPAEKLILMTDVKGVLDENGTLLSTLTFSQTEAMIASGVIAGGMIPKVRTCLDALEAGVTKCHIILGGAHSFMDEILTDRGVGTEFVADVSGG
ncbi:MAG: acetylglutamate kinase [Alphaproteobacteria bacterium RIFOXYD12_FULL_60_8]|nr:MAG: acetylglutamate kinase [Alphaproteobacteria bacterium RIFOXYD12_FULL_60_8]